MAQSKPMGIDKKKYQEAQGIKLEQDFKNDTCQSIQNIHFSINELYTKISSLEAKNGCENKECEIQIHKISDECKKTLKDIKQMVDESERQWNNCKNWLRTLNTAIEDCPTTQQVASNICDLQREIQEIREENESIRKEFNGLIERQRIDLERKMSLQKEEILNVPSDIPNLRKSFEQKIELVELNGQNSILRSSNNEKQILLVERKIENIYQLIKRLEISIQEKE